MSATIDRAFPADSIVPLQTAFDMLGRYAFVSAWTEDMARCVRLGRRDIDLERRAMGRWALKALRACVRNGWLPLFYFVEGRRIRYFENPNGFELSDLYPQPIDDEPGQIELSDGATYPCEVDATGFGRLLRRKFPMQRETQRGRRPKYPEFRAELDRYFRENPFRTLNGRVIQDLGKLLPESQLPKKTTLHEQIDKARDRAAMRVQSGNAVTGPTPDARD